MLAVVAGAVIGPLAGYEMGRRMGARVIGSRFLRRISGTVEKAVATLHAPGAIAVLPGRFTSPQCSALSCQRWQARPRCRTARRSARS